MENDKKDFIQNENETPTQNGEKNDGGDKTSHRSFIIFLYVLGGILIFSIIYGLATRNLKGVMGIVGSVALALLVLLIMITVHEFGHYVAGKAFGFGI
ncbi:MAG: hypothetical protein J6Z34_05500, partial [Clostridia bacterium]|nr:hypothetical protein [Clostridia bacterium]